MFLWLGLALLVDGVDGTFARALDVAERLPRWSGDTLDLVVDFITYVFVPAYAIMASGLMPHPLGTAGRLRDRDDERALFRRPQHEDGGQSFPRLSGGVEPGGVLSVAAQAAPLGLRWPRSPMLAVLTFVPVRFVHPFRVAQAARR